MRPLKRCFIESKLFHGTLTISAGYEEAPQYPEMQLVLNGYGLTTAEFPYQMPDCENVLNSDIRQTCDLEQGFPEGPQTHAILPGNPDSPLHSVRHNLRKQTGPGKWLHIAGEVIRHLLLPNPVLLFGGNTCGGPGAAKPPA